MEQEKFWVGVAFAAALLVLLGITVFIPPQKNASNVLRLLGAICAGASAIFITGSSLIEIRGQVSPGVSALIQGTGGIVLFLVVWWQWGVHLPPGTVLRTTPNGTFRQTAIAIAQLDHAVVEFRNFSNVQLESRVGDYTLRGRTISDIYNALSHALAPAIPAFQVSNDGNKYTLTASGASNA